VIVGVLVVLSVVVGVNVYVARRLLQWSTLVFPGINPTVFVVVYVVLAASFLVGYAPLPVPVRRTAAWIGGHWTGVFVYLLMFFVVAEVVVAAGRLVKIVPTPVPVGVRFGAGLVVVLSVAGLAAYGVFNAHRVTHVSYDVQLDEALPSSMTIVLVSDLHLGSVGSERNLARVVEEINRLEPDLVCLAGDIFNDDYRAIRDPDAVGRSLSSIRSTYGVYAALGNHDSGMPGATTFDEMVDLLERSDIRVLKDEYETIDDRIVLVGRLDWSPIGNTNGLARQDTASFMSTVDTDLPVVVMDHNPATIGQYGAETDLILAGHTHRGQMFPANLITGAMYAVDYGYYRKDADSPQVVVTSGAGTWAIPMRIGSRSEVVSITLH